MNNNNLTYKTKKENILLKDTFKHIKTKTQLYELIMFLSVYQCVCVSCHIILIHFYE